MRCLGSLLWLGECLPLLPILLLITDIVALTASNAARWQLDTDIVVTLGNASDSISGRTAEQRDELAPRHSITLSARNRKLSEMVSPIAFAVLRLIASVNLVGCITFELANGRHRPYQKLGVKPPRPYAPRW
jgi:hypothetical protein